MDMVLVVLVMVVMIICGIWEMIKPFLLFIAIVLSISLILAMWVKKRYATRWGFAVFCLVWAVALSPELIIRAQFHHLCQKESGVHIYQTITSPKSLYLKGGDGGYVEFSYLPKVVKKYLDEGYESIEAKSGEGDLYRFWLDKNGQITWVKIYHLTSHYEKDYQIGDIPITHSIFGDVWGNGDTITDRYTGKKVAENKTLNTKGSPWLSIFMIGQRKGSYCYDKNADDLRKIYLKATKTTD